MLYAESPSDTTLMSLTFNVLSVVKLLNLVKYSSALLHATHGLGNIGQTGSVQINQ